MTKKIISLLIAALMIIAVLPVASIAGEISDQAYDKKQLAKLDEAWASINAVEAEAFEKKATPHEVAMAAYNAALNEPLVDEKSIVWEGDSQFAFTVDGMHCVYCYRILHTAHEPAVTTKTLETVTKGVSGSAGSPDVLLVGPFYGDTSSNGQGFTDQYRTEAQSIAEATGGSLTILEHYDATGPAIAANYTNKGVVIYDSHGVQSGTSSYLVLTSSSGITNSDLTNGYAISSNGYYCIDGRYIKNYVSGTLSNCIVWMAICEGMKKAGKGTTGTALLEAGAACVYGYSQSVSFTGDYEYEATFWTQMKNGATVAEAFNVMTSTHGNWDPAYSSSSGSAWPVVMSATDAFPSDPDSHQTVTCDWTLFTQEPVALQGITVTPATAETLMNETVALTLTANPSDANGYSVTWSTSNAAVATVSGNNRGATVTAKQNGVVTITATAADEVSGNTYTASAQILVKNGYIVDRYEPTTTIETGVEYLIGYQNGEDVYLLMNYNPNPISSGYYGGSNYYYNNSSNYVAYGIKAVLDEDNCVIAVDNGTYANATLDHVEWKFEANGNYYKIASDYDQGYYLGVYSSTNYSDLYASSSSSLLYTNWSWDQANSSLVYNGSSTKYITFLATAGSYSNFFQGTTSNTNSSLKLYKHVHETVIEEDSYTVTFKDWDGAVLSTQEVDKGEAAIAPANPTRVGYTFIGWDVDFSNVQSDLVVTAQYTINTYTVTFKDWDGRVIMTQTVAYGEAATAPADPTREGYTFIGWDVDFTNVTSNLVVTAQYEENEIPSDYLKGDVNCDGFVDTRDLALAAAIAMNAGSTSAQGVANGDMNGDGLLNSSDLSSLAAYIGG